MVAIMGVAVVALGLILGFSGLGRERVAKADSVSILVLDTSGCDTQIVGALTGAAFTEVSPSGFATVELTAYDVLYVGATFQDPSVTVPSQAALDALNARQSDIADFVESGHAIVALSEPLGNGRFAWLPPAVTPSAKLDDEHVHIVEPGHPVMEGLTGAGLSNWKSSCHHAFTDAGSLTVLAVAADSGDLPVILAGTFGSGRIVVTGQDPDWHYCYGDPYPQLLGLVQNAVDWVTEAPPVGGIAELPAIGGASPEEAGAPAEGSAWSAGGYAALAGGLAAVALFIAVGGLYARKRGRAS